MGRFDTIPSLTVRWIVSLAGIAIAITGASPAGQDPPTTPPAESSARREWRLTFQVSGGFTAMDRHLELDGSGAFKATDRRRGAQATGRLAESELRQISDLVTSLKADGVARNAACRDCLQYDLAVYHRDRSVAFRLNDATVAGAPSEQCIRVLRSLLDRELTNPRTP